MIKHLTYPDNFMSEMETTIAQIAGLADDPKMKVIVVNQAIPGTAEAFRRVKEKRPDILCFAGEAHEDPNVIATIADVTINADFVSRGYLIIDTAKKAGMQNIRTYLLPASHELRDTRTPPQYHGAGMQRSRNQIRI